jgi:6-pyruvoyl-tetrahydropterin synthase
MSRIIRNYDHYFLLWEGDELCDTLDFLGEEYVKLPFQTSAENMSIWLFNEIKNYLPISKIELKETKSSNIVYEGIM